MKLPNSVVSRDRDTDMNSTMTPMIDVVFLLLIFFVWTASFQVIEHVMKSEMSAEVGSAESDPLEPLPEQDFDKIVVRIGWDGTQPTWNVRESPVSSIEEVETILQSIAAIKIDAPIILHPDSIVPLGHVIEAFDLSKQVGFQKVSFAVNPAQP